MPQQEVIADLDGIRQQIKNLAEQAKVAAENTRRIGDNLKFDPNDVEQVEKRFKSLEEELRVNNALVEKYKEALKGLEARKKELENITEATEKQQNEYKKVRADIDKYTKALDKANKSVDYLTAATNDHNKAQAIARAQVRKTEEEFELLRKTTTKLNVVLLAAVAALAKMAQSSIEQGKELYNLSVRYNTNTEDIQGWNMALEQATGQSDLYTASLKRIVAGMAEIEAHRGVNYRRALTNIGLNYTDISELSTTEQFEAIIDKLAEMEDATARLSAARTLLGDEGAVIAQMFEKEGFDIEVLKQQAQEYGVIQQQTAEELANMSFELATARLQMQKASAELTIGLTPAIETFANIVKTLSGMLGGLAKAFKGMGSAGQIVFLMFMSLTIIIPKAILWFVKLRAEMKKAEIQANVTGIAVKSIGIGIAGMLATTAIGFAVAQSETKKLNDEMQNLNDTVNQLSGAGEDFGANVESVTTSMSSRTISVNVDIYGHGDTPNSDELAMNTSQLTIDEIQRQLGDLIKG